MKRKTKEVIEILIVIALFIFASYLAKKNLEFFENLIISDISGIIIFIFIEIISIVIAPVTTLPLISVASNLWGWVLTGIICIFAWTLGSWIAFVIARRYGTLIVKKFISMERVHEIEKKIPQEHLFWSVVLLRLVIPVDILSYALGIFTKMKTEKYLLATLIGIIPFAFAWAYLGTVDFYYQIIIFLIALVIFLIVFFIRRKIKKRSRN